MDLKLNFSVENRIGKIKIEDWNFVLQDKNIYLSIPYLSAIEDSLSNKIEFRYLIFYDQNLNPVAIAAIQSIIFIDKGFEDKDEICNIRNVIKKKLLTSKGIQMIICGTPFASGENGFYFSSSITIEVAYKNLTNAIIQLQKTDNKFSKIDIILFKELFPNSFQHKKSFQQNGFNDFHIDVNMILNISPQWKSLNDYFNSMVTKFRTKAKTALKKSEQLRVENFDSIQIEKYKNEIQDLYLHVLEKSSFQFGILNEKSFLNLKLNLKENFILKAYFLDDSLVGFSTSFIFNSILDANYVGIDYKLNIENAIYQRMLYDYVELAIQRNCKELRFGRTAEEIKSSVGAIPVSMKLFVRHKNTIANKILKAIVSTINPSEFELRKPFKKEFLEFHNQEN